MRAEHRHELKANELVDWLTHLPEWARNNIGSIVTVVAVIAAAGIYYGWRNYSRSAAANTQITLTRLINQITASKLQILETRDQTRDMSFVLLQPAEGLRAFAGVTDERLMGALALLKRAEALRAELHYRISPISLRDLATQVGLAQDSYRQAMEKASPNMSLMAAAAFGTGLCEEDLGNFDKAQQLYTTIVNKADFEPTVAYAQAKHRLQMLNDYKQTVVFKPAPVIGPADLPGRLGPVDPNRLGPVSKPAGAAKPADANSAASTPADANRPTSTSSAAPKPADVNKPSDANSAAPSAGGGPATKDTSGQTGAKPVANRDANSPAGTVDVNKPAN